MKTKLKRLYILLKLFLYNISLIVEDFINKLNGRTHDFLSIDEVREVRQQENLKLRAALQKLRSKIYKYDEEKGVYVLQDFAKQKDFDLVKLLNEEPLTLRQKLKVARLQAKILKNPTDHSGTEDAMVKHNVKNAQRYHLERERRSLAKMRQEALKNGNSSLTRELTQKINSLNTQIRRLKDAE